jgi:hypothetical protein
MANPTSNPDPRFSEYNPGTCKSCGNELKFAWEIENGNLCSNCGPGSLKWQKAEDQKHDQNFIEQSDRYAGLRSDHDAMAAGVKTAIDRNFDPESVNNLKTLADKHEAMIGAQTAANQGQLNTNAEATQARINETENPRDSRETGTPEEHVTNADTASFQTKDV